jgi:dolichyl-phosphate beta-glucosyltransferase
MNHPAQYSSVVDVKRPFDLTLVIPAYNEEKRISITLQKVTQYLLTHKLTCELVIVNDGSSDKTTTVVSTFIDNLNADIELKLLSHKKRSGKGWAVRTGMLAAQGRYVLFMDADLSVPIDEIDIFLKKIKDYDVVIGTRKVKGARVEVHQPFFRELLGKGFTKLSNFILGTHYSDFTCGFKIFKAAAAATLFEQQKLPDWSFDSEILYLAHKQGFKVLEQPVRWINDPNTKVRLYRDVVISLLGLLKIRRIHG